MYYVESLEGTCLSKNERECLISELYSLLLKDPEREITFSLDPVNPLDPSILQKKVYSTPELNDTLLG
jgi:hypothetical protein